MREVLVSDLRKIKLFVIYLGDHCNFDCSYCDRGYIKSLGGQSLSSTTRDEMKEYFEWLEQQDHAIEKVSFHGGEPMLFVKRMDEIMRWLYPMAKRNGWVITMTTNGSLVAENEWFFERYGDVLYATISYDFNYQGINRELFDVDAMARVLNKHITAWQWQFVIPIDDPSSFSFNTLKDVVSTCYRTNCRVVNIIPLRHKRGKDKFDVIIDRLDLEQFWAAFLEFIQILYVKKIDVWIDGNYNRIDKAYFAEHQKAVLSPDGYLYPEFEFLEYKIKEARIGSWKDKTFWTSEGDEGKIREGCMTCEQKATCGLKYLYYMFDEEPKGNCVKFYRYLDAAIKHNTALLEEKTLLHHIGFENVEINS